MFYLVLRKKTVICFAAILLFAFITAIIILKASGSNDTKPSKLTFSEDETILIIDAGHGGADGGASSAAGTLESEVNLEISLKMQQIMSFLGIKTAMTRSSDDLAYPPEADTISAKKVWDQHRRLAQINETANALLISIHQNSYPTAAPKGSQVLYAKTSGSKELGELVHNNLIDLLNPDNRRVAEPASDKIYLMSNCKCPAILVECGFLSNREEAELLGRSEYTTKLAAVISASYLQYIG